MAYISIITDEKNSLTKHFSLDEDGSIKKSAPGHLVKGTIRAVDVDAIQLIDIIKNLEQNQCLCLGVLDTPDETFITCNKMAQAGQATRSKDHLSFFPGNSFLLLDFDESGLTPEQAIDLLGTIDPQFKTSALVVIPSSSSYIYTTDGREIIGEGNYHIFIELKGDRDPKEYSEILFNRLLLKGHVNPYITKAGSIVIKSIFDKVTGSAEREIFSANPVCEEPLVSKRLEHIQWQEGSALDSDTIPGITPDEDMELRLKLKELRETHYDEAVKKREAYYQDRAKSLAQQRGTSVIKERPNVLETPILYDRQGRPILELCSDEQIMDEQGNWFYVRTLLINPVEGLKLPDPVEPFKRGDEKKGKPGRGIATVLNTMIYSHHHCGVIYLLKWTASDLEDFFASDDYTNEEKTFVWNAVSKGKQELTSATQDHEISELADKIKHYLDKIKSAKTGREKKHIVAALKTSTVPEGAENDKILEMSARYGVLNYGGKAVVVSERWNAASEEFEVEFALPSSMDTMTKNQPMRLPGVQAPVSMYKFWEQHPERRTYDGVDFRPCATIFREPGKLRVLPAGPDYNLFQGYMYSPEKATSCDLILKHIKEVWCSSIQEEYDYVIGWLAHLFQYPERLSTTALVMQSVPGAGKGIIIENCIVKPLGVHAISTSNTEDLVGRFNFHMGTNIFFYSNEMSYTAQTSLKSQLKTLTETDTRMVEAKNVNKIKTRNYTSVIFSSNDEWVLNIDYDDRRFVYLTVSSHRVRDKEYFVQLKKQIDNGGKDAFLKYLLAYDLSKYDHNSIPNHNHKQRQADFLRSAHPAVKFIWSLYDTDFGVLHFSDDPSYKQLKDWQVKEDVEMSLSKAQLFSLYRTYCEYFKIERKYDDPGSIAMQLEVGGVLKRETDPRTTFVMRRGKKDKKEVYIFKSVIDGKSLLRVSG